MARVVQGKDADVAGAADLEAIDAAVRGDEPRSLFGVAMDRTEETKRKVAYGSGVRIDRDAFALMTADDVASLGCNASQKVTIAFAFRNYVNDVAVNECVIIFWILLF